LEEGERKWITTDYPPVLIPRGAIVIGGAGEVAMEDYEDTIFEGYNDDLQPPRYQ
jgi:hypothetical protein